MTISPEMTDERPPPAVVGPREPPARPNIGGVEPDPGNVTTESAAPTSRRHRGLVQFAGPVVFVLSLVVAGAVLWRQGSLDDVGEAVRGADTGTIAAAVLLYVVGLALLCLRWHVLVLMTKGASDLAKATEVFLISVALNYVAPLKLAIPMRAAMTKKALGLNATETGAVVLWEGMADVGILAIGVVIWLLISGDAFDEVLDAVGGAGPAYLALAALLAVATGVAWAIGRRRPALRARVRAALVRALRYPRQRPVEGGTALGLTVVYWALQAGVLWILLDSLGGNPSGGLVFGMATVPILFGMLSPGPGGAGVREALMVAVAGAYGADAALALVAAVAYRAALFVAIPILYVLAKVWIGVRR